MYLQNCQQRPWILPANPANESHVAKPINPGAAVEIDPEHWAAVRKGNDVITYLLAERFLVATNDEPLVQPHLRNPPTADRPAELQDPEDILEHNIKTETVVVGDDTPAPRRGRRAS